MTEDSSKALQTLLARIKSQSIEAIYKHAIEGYKAMPAKGGCISCSDEEIQMAVDYMLEKSK